MIFTDQVVFENCEIENITITGRSNFKEGHHNHYYGST